LWLRRELRIGGSEVWEDEEVENEDDSIVKFGYLKRYKLDGNQKIHEVIHAGSTEEKRFIVYEDGSFVASGVVIEGTINATGGSIGGVNIEEWGYELRIESDQGIVFKNNTSGTITTLTAKIYNNGAEVDDTTLGKIEYYWYKDNNNSTIVG
jgi:hypothetical protein